MLIKSAPLGKPKPRLCREGRLCLLAFFSIAAFLSLPACYSCEENDASTKQISSVFETDYVETEVRRLFNIPENKAIDWTNWATFSWTDGDWSSIPAGQDSAYEIVWFSATSKKTGESKTARYKVRFTTGKNSPDPSAGFGYGSEAWAEILDYQLIDVIKRPKVNTGVYPMLPGECVIRPIPQSNGTGKQLLETYQIEIPSGVHFEPSVNVRPIFDSEMVDYTVEKGNQKMVREKVSPSTEYFVTRQRGIYTVNVFRTTRKPDKEGKFGIEVTWGRASGGGCEPDTDAPPKKVLQDAGVEKELSNTERATDDTHSIK